LQAQGRLITADKADIEQHTAATVAI